MKIKFQYITQPENFFQAIFRFLSTLIVKAIYKLPISPNQVTLTRTVVVIISLYFFSIGDAKSLIIAVILFYVFEILDHVDGDLARYKNIKSNLGPLLEQFIDTWSSRPSNIFGFSIALGVYNQTQSLLCFILFGLTVMGRLLWLEYRNDFGWKQEEEHDLHVYMHIYDKKSILKTISNFFRILYIWNNTFLLLGALLYSPFLIFFNMNSLIIAFCIVAILNNLPWIFIVIKGFSQAYLQDKRP
jgi:phosphatidylglycerophosphate synthase